MSTFVGFDFSRWQGLIDWPTVAANANFAFYKGGGGDDGNYVDDDFLNNHAGARACGINHGVYWFAGGTDPIAEADYFYQQCLTNLIPGEVVVLDAERGNAIDPNWAIQFLNHLESLIGFKPVIYMNLNTENNHDWSTVVAQNYGLWLADWDGDPNINVNLAYWSFCAFQQWTNAASCPGVSGRIDGDAFFAPDMSYFAKYGKQPVVVVTPPVVVLPPEQPVTLPVVITPPPVVLPPTVVTPPVVPTPPTPPVPPVVTPKPVNKPPFNLLKWLLNVLYIIFIGGKKNV